MDHIVLLCAWAVSTTYHAHNWCHLSEQKVSCLLRVSALTIAFIVGSVVVLITEAAVNTVFLTTPFILCAVELFTGVWLSYGISVERMRWGQVSHREYFFHKGVFSHTLSWLSVSQEQTYHTAELSANLWCLAPKQSRFSHRLRRQSTACHWLECRGRDRRRRRWKKAEGQSAGDSHWMDRWCWWWHYRAQSIRS